jgi:hydrogenase/urease accessory protein HupE
MIIAHLMNTGFGPFYDGLLHLFVTLEDLLPVVALVLLAGLRGARFGRAVLWTLPAAWIAGSIVGMFAGPAILWPVATAALTIALGVLAAADKSLPVAVVVALAVMLGLVNGGRNGLELTAAGGGVGLVAGIATALCVLVSVLAGHVTSLRAGWARVAVRVAGSWIAAVGLLIVGWVIRNAGL